MIDPVDFANCYGNGGTIPPEMAHCALDGVTPCEASVTTFNMSMDSWIWKDILGVPYCCILSDDRESAEACCDPLAFFWDDSCRPYEGKDATCEEEALTLIQSRLLQDCPWMQWDWDVTCTNPGILAVTALQDEGDTCGDLHLPAPIAQFDAQIDPLLSHIDVDWSGGPHSVSSLDGNLLASSSPNEWLTGFAYGVTSNTPEGTLLDPMFFFDGSILMGSGSQPQSFTVPAAQGYSIYAQGTLEGTVTAWEINPEENAVGVFDSSSGEWWLHLTDTLGDGTSVVLHLEGDLLTLSEP